MREEAVRAAAEAQRELAALREAMKRRPAASHPEAETQPRTCNAANRADPHPSDGADTAFSTRVPPDNPAHRPQQAPTARELWLRGATDRSTPFVADAQTIVARDVAAGGDARARGTATRREIRVGRRRGQAPRPDPRSVRPEQHEESIGRRAGAGQVPCGQAGQAFVLRRRLAPTVVASRLQADEMTKMPISKTRTTVMTPTDRLQEEGFRPLVYRLRSRASTDAMEGFVHPVPKALLKTGALVSETIA